jgi:hypothetical protein
VCVFSALSLHNKCSAAAADDDDQCCAAIRGVKKMVVLAVKRTGVALVYKPPARALCMHCYSSSQQ